jgi:starch-binding outer membrane protein, SusD/RagB family
MKTKHKKYFAVLILTIFIAGCGEKWLDEPRLETDAPLQGSASSVAGLDAYLTGSMASIVHDFVWTGYMQILGELLGDNIAPTANMTFSNVLNTYESVYRRDLFEDTWGIGGRFTQYASGAVAQSNIVIDACRTDLAAKDPAYIGNKDRLLGEALFIRSIVQFQQLRMYNRQWDMNTSKNYERGAILRERPIYGIADIPKRPSSTEEGYTLIISALEEAITLLPDYWDSAKHPVNFRSRGNKSAALALLARVYFQKNDFENCLRVINLCIGSTPGSPSFPLETNINNLWNRIGYTTTTNSQVKSEVIFENVQLSPLIRNKTGGTLDGVLIKQLKDVQVKLSNSFKDSANFNLNDNRFKNWIKVYKSGKNTDDQLETSFATYTAAKSLEWCVRKYTTNATGVNVTMIRSSELMLMRAEINARKNLIADAAADINEIRIKHGGVSVTAMNSSLSKSAALKEIYTERIREMFGEGDRGWDLLRLGSLTNGGFKLWKGDRDIAKNHCYSNIENVDWNSNALRYPLQTSEANKNPLWNQY